MGYTTDHTLTVLANRRRREILHYLKDCSDDRIPVEDIVEACTDSDATMGVGNRIEDERTRIELEHVHLPKLQEAGLIDYDRRTGSVRYRSRDDVEALLRFVEETFE